MTAITLPTELVPATTELSIVSNDRVFESPQTGARQYASRIGNRLSLTWTFANLASTDRYILIGYLAQLHGRQNTVRTKIHTYTRQASATGTITTNATTNAGATTITTTGWPASAVCVQQGDLIQIGNQITICEETRSSDGSGNCSLKVFPEVFKQYASSTSIDYADPEGDFFLAAMPRLPSLPKSGTDWLTSATVQLIQDVLA